MGLNVGGHAKKPDWPKLGPSLLIATALIVAIRTAKWPAQPRSHSSDPELDREIDFAAYLADAVLNRLLRAKASLFPQREEPWYVPDEEDAPE